MTVVSRNISLSEHIRLQSLWQSGKKDLLNLTRWEGRSFSLPESFGAGAMLQHCLVTWQLASHWLHRLMICTKFCVFQFLNSLGNISTNDKKSIITIVIIIVIMMTMMIMWQAWREDTGIGNVLARMWLLLFHVLGVSTDMIQTYNRLLAMVAVVFGDFSVYFFTFVVTHVVLTLA